MGEFLCKVCKDKVACRAVDEELEKGMTGAAVARLMTLRGFPVSAQTMLEHNKHRRPMATPDVAKNKRDAAVMIRDRMAKAIENLPEADPNDTDAPDPILAKNLQPALKTVLGAQSLIDKREARTDDKKAVFQLAVLLAGGPAGFLAPPELTSGEVIDGEAEEITDG